MKNLVSILLVAILVGLFFIDEASLQQGIYKSKTALVAGVAFIVLALNFLIHTNYVKGWTAWLSYGAIVFLGLFIPTLF